MIEGLDTAWVDLLRRLAPLLPADLFDRLRALPSPASFPADKERAFADCIEQAIAALDALHHTLATFLPRYLLDRSPAAGEPYGELLTGSFIFADVTGFTALTGELSRRGTEGREEMNRLMRALFAALLDPLLASGGDLLIFAGDAVLASFPGRPEGEDARWAARTALRLVRAITPFESLQTPFGTFSLTMSAGVERGQAFAAVVGTRKRMELLITAGPVQGAMCAEGEAQAGQVFAGPGIRPLLCDEEFMLQDGVVAGVRGGELDDYEAVPPARRRRRLSAFFSRRIPDLLEYLRQALAGVEALMLFVPPDLFTQIARREDIRQHPPVAIQFVNVLGIEEMALGTAGPEKAAAVLQRYFVQAQEIVQEREGIVSQVDPYACGFTLLNAFGAPTHHEGVPGLAASAALELAHAVDRVNREFDLKPPLTQRVGLTYDRIFTGEIGYRHRREYVVAGPAVNLAARLMSKASPDQIVLDPAAWNAVQTVFLGESLPAIPLKGIPEPVPRVRLRGLRRGQGLRLTDYPLVGRGEQMAELESRLDAASGGRGGAVAIVAEAGAGKSRFVDAVATAACRRGMTVLAGRCHPFGETSPYLPWADVVSHWAALDDATAPETRRRLLEDRLAQFDIAPFLPAFADLLGLPPVRLDTRVAEAPARRRPGLYAAVTQRSEQEGADGQGLATVLAERLAGAASRSAGDTASSIWEVLRQRASVPHALATLLKRLALSKPVLVVIEDIQWMDLDSRRVLHAIAAASRALPLLVVITARPEAGWTGERLLLPPLPDPDGRALAALALRATRLQPELAAWLLGRARGNPLFIIAYCRALQDAGAVVVDAASDEARWSGPPPSLPISLQGLLLAEVDRLGQEAREVLQRAAVVGLDFPVQLLTRVWSDTLRLDAANDVVERAARRSVVAPPPPAQTHTFSSPSVQDAIYEALSHAVRQAWHERIGDCLAEADEPTRYERLEQLAHHYSRGSAPYKAALFTRLAGDKARSRQADEAALTFYAQTLAVADGEPVAAQQRLAQEGMGDVRALQGDTAAACAAYQAALAGAAAEETWGLRAKLALLGPLVGVADPEPVWQIQEALPPSHPLRRWLDAARVWLSADQDTAEATSLCRRLMPVTGEPVRTLLQEALARLESKRPLPPYADFLALFAHSCLRQMPGGRT